MDIIKYDEKKKVLKELDELKKETIELKRKLLNTKNALSDEQKKDEINKYFESMKSIVWGDINEYTKHPELFIEKIKRFQNDVQIMDSEHINKFIKTSLCPEKTKSGTFFFEAVEDDGVRTMFKQNVSEIASQFANYSYEEYVAQACSVSEILHITSEMVAQKSGIKKYELLSQLKDFMNQDLQLKKKMAELAPHVFFQSMSEITKMHNGTDKYAEALDNLIQDAHKAVSLSMKMVGGNQENVDKVFEHLHYRLNKCYSSDPNTYEYNLNNFYRDDVASMRAEFEKNIKGNLIGYYLRRNYDIVKNAFSINEALHFAHASITNSEDMYYNLPKVSEKISHLNTCFGERSEHVFVFGENTEFANKLSGAFAALQTLNNPLRRADITIIMSFDDHAAAVMARDLGHATVFSFSQTEDGKARMEYAIPKICNKDMIMRLPNVSYQEDMTYAHGSIECEPSEIYQRTMEVAYNIPTDGDARNDSRSHDFMGIEDIINDLSKEGLQHLIDTGLTEHLIINQDKINVEKVVSPQLPDVELDFETEENDSQKRS